ncbi:4741_t:CDS:2 [Diversispora eburnea]|uniref:4741_t:CDS:1 n=1 Tax=Diversispora eburnea TaxID=1213867 RepID=A0A9N8UWZ1_9GLOM|nr:4741_t:CDS:2 [Diversispora eburnea]
MVFIYKDHLAPLCLAELEGQLKSEDQLSTQAVCLWRTGAYYGEFRA